MRELDIVAINKHAILAFDKWNRMLCGLASTLERYENRIIYLKINNTEKMWPSTNKTAIRIIHEWMKWNPELVDTKGFVVEFYINGSTGFMENTEALNNTNKIRVLVESLTNASSQTPQLVSIFSGLFCEVAKVCPKVILKQYLD